MNAVPTHETRPERRARAAWALRALLVVVATGASIAAWVYGLPAALDLRNWFYPVRWRELDASPLAFVLGALVPLLLVIVWRAARARRHVVALALLVGTSLAAQTASLLLVGPELETALERFEGGHGDFLRAAHAARERRLRDLLAAYPEEAEAGTFSNFGKSKPPGTFALYAWIEREGRTGPARTLLAPLRRLADRRPRLRTHPEAVAAAIVAFPVITSLVVIPIVLLGWALSGRSAPGYAAAVLWATCPAVLVVTHHADGSWYALLATTACALAALGGRTRRAWISGCGGLVLALGIWSSYGLLPVLALALGAQGAAVLAVTRSGARLALIRAVARQAIAFVLGLATGIAALVEGGVFPQPLEGYRTAMRYHTLWKMEYVGGVWGLTGGLELWMWVGFPLLALMLVAIATSARDLRSRSSRVVAALGAAFVAVHVVVMLVAGSNESARLWLFQVPIVAAIAGLGLARVRGGSSLLALAVLAQLALVPITRAWQPW
ncbi:hypothetical protein [Sandaracinus amylolyticus]|uniref:Glycosyltransferase RgtA/B/C/D-like domain-containing protein n=1 Tax=Sandaracinus amylolyticus TaxID=927083 RepID=A0A0F6YJ76_9BACT|nr:hypothetical protein [Sandaracinus amylolyticus]AKF05895.1 hypothetical protein DB32_003044 [Sandaracinus amylolyticus]